MKTSNMKLEKLARRNGFFSFLKVMNENIIENKPMEYYQFLNQLHFYGHYYNAFYRVQEKLKNYGLIKIEKIVNKRFITVTEKGIEFFRAINYIESILEKGVS